MPSNRARTNVVPGCLKAVPKLAFFKLHPPIWKGTVRINIYLWKLCIYEQLQIIFTVITSLASLKNKLPVPYTIWKTSLFLHKGLLLLLLFMSEYFEFFASYLACSSGIIINNWTKYEFLLLCIIYRTFDSLRHAWLLASHPTYGTQQLDEPVSNTTEKRCGGAPRKMSP